MMGRCVRIAAVAIIISRCLAGCSFAAPLQDGPRPEDDFTVSAGTSADSTVEPTAIPADTTVPTCGETEPIQTVFQPEPDDGDFVMVAMYIPDIVVELRYSTTDNFTNQQIYSFTDGWLRYGTVKKLMSVQKELGQNGYSLKLWDGFRPPSAQYRLWEVYPDPVYVANPNNGFSSHSRGNTVDITLVHMDGTEAVMPTDFDDFSGLADRNYSDCGKEAADNALYLEQVMIKHGFKPYSGEWWHFTDMQTYPVEETFEPIEAAMYYADCNEYISLRTKPSTGAEAITRIFAGEQFIAVANSGEFTLIEYQGLFGYVLSDYIKPC